MPEGFYCDYQTRDKCDHHGDVKHDIEHRSGRDTCDYGANSYKRAKQRKDLHCDWD